jgi:hypothetical protein
MAKIVTSGASSALNADILALFAEEDIDPMHEMILMVKNGHEVTDPDTGEKKYIPLDADQRFRILKELTEYTAPKLKAVDVTQHRKPKTIIKVVKHGERAIIANGANVMQVEGPERDYTKATVGGVPIEEAVEDAKISKVVIRSAAQMDAYGGITKLREEKQEVVDVEVDNG